MMISGPTLSGKSTFLFNMIKYRKEIMVTDYDRVIYCMPPENYQRKMDFVEKLRMEFPNLELILGLPKESEISQNGLPKLLIMGDYYNNKYLHQIKNTKSGC